MPTEPVFIPSEITTHIIPNELLAALQNKGSRSVTSETPELGRPHARFSETEPFSSEEKPAVYFPLPMKQNGWGGVCVKTLQHGYRFTSFLLI
ncbi:MAG: hypothetical protein N2035_05650 [Chthoniobacterales bacterium]|nr:hypothetical protein [Chthoniobacterales bacterium]